MRLAGVCRSAAVNDCPRALVCIRRALWAHERCLADCATGSGIGTGSGSGTGSGTVSTGAAGGSSAADSHLLVHAEVAALRQELVCTIDLTLRAVQTKRLSLTAKAQGGLVEERARMGGV